MALEFFRTLQRTTKEERELLFEIFAEGCPSELPDNVHISLDLLRRITDMPPAETLATLRGMASVGVEVEARDRSDHPDDDMIEVRWRSYVAYDDPDEDDFNDEMSTEVARQMLLPSSEDYCKSCALAALEALDFSSLSSAVATAGHRES